MGCTSNYECYHIVARKKLNKNLRLGTTVAKQNIRQMLVFGTIIAIGAILCKLPAELINRQAQVGLKATLNCGP